MGKAEYAVSAVASFLRGVSLFWEDVIGRVDDFRASVS